MIELLIVIAIIGILAGTVILALSSRTGDANKSRTKLGVSSMRTLAFAEVAITPTVSGQTLCNTIYGKVSGEKSGWEWNDKHQCVEGDLIANTGLAKSGARSRSSKDAAAGELCCHAQGTKWVLWGAFQEADGKASGKTEKDIYCADSKGFLGEVDLSVATNLNTASGAECQP